MKTKLFHHQQNTFSPHRLICFALVIAKDTSEQLGRHEGELKSVETIKDITEILKNARGNIVKARLRFQTLVRRKVGLVNTLNALNGRQKGDQEKLDKLHAELDLIKEQIEDLEQSITTLQKEIEDLEAQLALLNAKQARLTQLRDGADKHHSDLGSKLADNRKEIAKIEDQLQALESSRKLMGMVQSLDIDLLADRSFQIRHFEIEDGLAKIQRSQVEALRKRKDELEDFNRRMATAGSYLYKIQLDQELFKVEQAHVAGRKGVKEGEKSAKDTELQAGNAEAQKLGEDVDKLEKKIEERTGKIREKVKEIAENLQERKLKIRHVELKMDSLTQVEGALDQALASIDTLLLRKGKEKILLDMSVLQELEESLRSTYIKFLEALQAHIDVPEKIRDAALNLKLKISKRKPVTHKEKPIASMKYLLKDSEKISSLYDEAINSLTPDQQASKDALTLIKGRIDMKNTKSLTSLLNVKFDKAREEGTMVEIPALTRGEKASLASDKAQLDKDYVLALLDLFILHSNLPIVRDDLIFQRNKRSGTMQLNGVEHTFKLRVNDEKNILEIAINPENIDRIKPGEYKPVTSEHELIRAIRDENQRIIHSENPDKDRTTIYFSFTEN